MLCPVVVSCNHHMNIKNKIKQSRYWGVVTVSLPLVMSIAETTVMEFTDRVFLSNYSLDAIAAAMPSGYTAFLAMTFFMGIAGYLNVIIAQYTGACAEHRIGASLWQGIYFSIFSGLILCGIAFTGEMLFQYRQPSSPAGQRAQRPHNPRVRCRY